MARGMTGDWNNVTRSLMNASRPAVWEKAKMRAMMKEAHRIRKIMIQAFNAGGPPGKRWKRLSPITQLVSRAMGKGDRRPLMDTGNLRNSHTVRKVDNDSVFVGVHRSAKRKQRRTSKGRYKSGGTLVNIAMVHEYGAGPIYIRITEPMRYWWNKIIVPKSKGQLKPFKSSTIAIVIRIPPRPWVNPIWTQEESQSASNIADDTIQSVGLAKASGLIR